MQTFILGVLVGSAVVGIIAALVFINGKLKLLLNTLQVFNARLGKIEKVTEATMMAAENFVDALQNSAEQMGMRPMGGPLQNRPDDFQDLRETFEEGIRNLEEDPDEDEENWKKGP